MALPPGSEKPVLKGLLWLLEVAGKAVLSRVIKKLYDRWFSSQKDTSNFAQLVADQSAKAAKFEAQVSEISDELSFKEKLLEHCVQSRSMLSDFISAQGIVVPKLPDRPVREQLLSRMAKRSSRPSKK
jgi:SMC interacting uncharacterized protein involved in chromosome segregation